MNRVGRGLGGFSGWILGPKLLELAGDTWRRHFRERNHEIGKLEGRHAGTRRCFVIGNGPSLKGMDLRPLAGEFTIAANSFYKHPDASAIDLKYLCIFDPHFMQDQPRAVEWHQTVAQTLPGATMVLHESARPLVVRHGLYAGREVHYARSGFQTHELKYVDFDLRRPRNVGMTTGSTIAIPLAIFLGFREIVLIGFDCNWLADTGRSYHFYDTHEYFPEFDSVDKDGRGYGYEAFLRIIQREFESHRLIRAKAESLGVRIVNATQGGLLDVYERADYAALFAAPGGH
jgi:hypothetical protein